MASYLVTGTSRGLGLALVQHLARDDEGAKIIFATARKASPQLQELVDSSSGRVVFVQLDVVDLTQVKTAAGVVEEELKKVGLVGLDYMINNAAISSIAKHGIAAMTDLRDLLETNVVGVHNVISAFMPLLEAGSKKTVMNVSSKLGSMAVASVFAPIPIPGYKVSKAAVSMLTIQYAQAYADKGFIFMAISPGWVKTDMTDQRAHITMDEAIPPMLARLHSLTAADNGKFFNTHVKGWENNGEFSRYEGAEISW